MTFSIVALDRQTGELGVAVQTRWFAVGRVVPWVEPGVAAVATQSFAREAYGPELLELIRFGAAPADALAQLIAADEGRDVRQVGVVDAAGRTSAHTGSRCVPAAGHVTGDAVSCQANMMERPTVPAAMLTAFEAAAGDLAERLLAALFAAQAEGGDIRGRQSAALLVAPGGGDAEPWRRQFDLRIDDHPSPVDELGRLLRLARAERWMDLGEERLAVGDIAGSIAAFADAAVLAPDDDQVTFMLALGTLARGDRDAARTLAARAVAANPRWPEFARRLVEAGHAPAATLDGLAGLLEGSSPSPPAA